MFNVIGIRSNYKNKQMKIPKQIKIGNLIYKITFSDDITVNSCGRSGLVKQRIILNSEMSNDLQYETFLHEIIHQILDSKSFKQESADEKLVDVLATGFYQVLKDNKIIN